MSHYYRKVTVDLKQARRAVNDGLACWRLCGPPAPPAPAPDDEAEFADIEQRYGEYVAAGRLEYSGIF